MPAGLILVAWLVFFLIRNANTSGNGGGGGVNAAWLFLRGKVIGHKPPDWRSFHGRASRREWIIAMIWNGLVSLLVSIIPVVGPYLIVPWVFASFAVTARRLHDMKMTAWLQVTIPLALAAVVAVFGAMLLLFDGQGAADPTRILMPAQMIALFTILLCYFLLAVIAGTSGPNPYGEADPA